MPAIATIAMPLDAWLARPHVVVSMGPDADNDVENALTAQGLRRRVALVLPHWRASTEVLMGTDLVLTVASRTLDRVPRTRGLKAFAPPLPLPLFPFQHGASPPAVFSDGQKRSTLNPRPGWRAPCGGPSVDLHVTGVPR